MIETTKKPTEMLKDEHQAVLKKLVALEGIIGRLDARKDLEELGELAAFFKTEFWGHFDKEEQALFPEFDSFMPHGAGPIAVMMEEHRVLRDTNDVMQEAIARYIKGDDDAATKKVIKENVSHFVEFLRSHINKEDGILFAMADMHLDQRQNEKVARLFLEMDKSR